MYKCAVLLTVYNRKETTLKGLSLLSEAITKCSNVKFDIYMTDDGCTDGTSKAVQENFPHVHILKGSGSLFWSGGMRLAWETAAKEYEYDFYLWFNDDAEIYDDSLLLIIQQSRELNNQAIICGAFCNMAGDFVYGCRTQDLKPVIPNGNNQEAYFINGNLTLIPKYVFKILGNIDVFYKHDLGDWDYGLRAIKKGIKVVSSLGYVGYSQMNPILKIGRGRKMNTTLKKRLKYFYSPIGNDPRIAFRFNLRHFGLFRAIKYLIINHYLVIISDKQYLNFFNHESN